MTSSVTVSDKALEASYHVVKLISRQKKPHTIVKHLINQHAWKSLCYVDDDAITEHYTLRL